MHFSLVVLPVRSDFSIARNPFINLDSQCAKALKKQYFCGDKSGGGRKHSSNRHVEPLINVFFITRETRTGHYKHRFFEKVNTISASRINHPRRNFFRDTQSFFFFVFERGVLKIDYGRTGGGTTTDNFVSRLR